MSKRKNTVLFSILFIFVFIYLGKNSNLRGTRRFFISLKIAWILMFGGLDPANAKDNTIIPGAHGFKPPISRRNPNNRKLNNPALGGARQNTGKLDFQDFQFCLSNRFVSLSKQLTLVIQIEILVKQLFCFVE